MTAYRTIDGDMVDAICKAHYGDEHMTPAVYAANPGLAVARAGSAQRHSDHLA